MVQQISTIFGIFLSVILVYFNIRKRPETVYLGLFFVILCLYNYAQYVVMYSDSVFWISLLYIHTAFLGYLIGPVLFFYVRNSLSDDHKFRLTDILHLIPAIIIFLTTIKYLFLSWELKNQIAQELINDQFAFVRYNQEYIGWLIPTKFNILFRYVFVLVYAVFSIRLVILKDKTVFKSGKNKRSSLHSRWLFYLLIIIALLSLTQSFVVVQIFLTNSLKFYHHNILFHFISGTLLLGTILLPFFYPSVLYGMGHFNVPEVVSQKIIHHHQIDESSAKKSPDLFEEKCSPGFDFKYMKYIESLTQTCMETEKPYLQKDCNISFLAKIVNLPAHHLLYYFKEIKKQSFNDYRNEWRVQHAKGLIEDIKTKDYTIEAIGLLSGFSSKNTFFVAFKKFTGTTPGAYASQFSKRD